MDLGLRGKRAIVFGSSSGLGRAVAQSLVEEGVRVAVVSRDKGRARSAAAEIGAELALAIDLANAGEGASAVGQAADAFDGLDICVINTGGGTPGPIMATDGDDDAAYRSMLRPVLEISRCAAPIVTERGDGRLVYLAARSIAEATPDLALSSVFRSGVHAAARSLALELAPRATVNVVVTGQFDTPALARFEAAKAKKEGTTPGDIRSEHIHAIPMGRLGTANELADVVTFLCSSRASYVTGAAIRVDGGSIKGF